MKTATRTKPLLSPKIEAVLRQIILKDLEHKGRVGFDRPHTEAVVYWMKTLLARLNTPQFDPQVLITAAYAHDWGYAGLFEGANSRSLEVILSRKKLHMKRGAEMIERLLYSRLAKQFAEAQIVRVAHLVRVHDKVRELRDEDELLLMECDTLGMLDTERVKSTFSSKADEARFLEKSIHNLRLPRFVHDEARVVAEGMLRNRVG